MSTSAEQARHHLGVTALINLPSPSAYQRHITIAPLVLSSLAGETSIHHTNECVCARDKGGSQRDRERKREGGREGGRGGVR